MDCQSSLSSGVINPWCQYTKRCEENRHQKSWNTSSESRATTTLISTNKEMQQIWQITSQGTPIKCTKRSTAWNWRWKTTLKPLCRPTCLLPLPTKKYSRQCEMTYRCKNCHNPSISKQDQQAMAPYRHTFKELTTSDDIVLRGNKILMPSTLQSKAVLIAHGGHQGLLKRK